MTHIIGGDQPQSSGKGPIHAAIARAKAARQAKQEVKNMEMTTSTPSAPAKDKELSFTHADWVKIYEGMLSHTLAAASERITKLSSNGGTVPCSYILTHRLFTDRLVDHSSGAAAVVGVEISLRENGVARSLTRVTRFFRTILEFNEGKDQGLMESLQQVMADFVTFAVTTDIATRYEQQTNKDAKGSS